MTGGAERILVTGAGGFVGGRVCADLAATGWRVRGLYRTPPRGGPPAGVEVAMTPDIADRPALREALRGVDAVVHLAARVHVMRDTTLDPLVEYRRVNVEGTRALLDEATRAGVRRFVLASSVKAVGESSDDAPLTEEVEPRPVDPYGVSKLEAERLVRALAEDTGIRWAALRLPLVYGPGVGANMLSLIRVVDRGLPLPFGSIRNRRSVAFVGNVAAAVSALLGTHHAASGVFFVSDASPVSTPELIREIARALGRPARLLPVPPGVFRAAGRLGDAARRVAPVPFDGAVARRLLGSLVVDPSRLRRETGFVPPFSLRDGLAETARWYRRDGDPSAAARPSLPQS